MNFNFERDSLSLKRIIAILLTFVLIVTQMSITAFAEDDDPADNLPSIGDTSGDASHDGDISGNATPKDIQYSDIDNAYVIYRTDDTITLGVNPKCQVFNGKNDKWEDIDLNDPNLKLSYKWCYDPAECNVFSEEPTCTLDKDYIGTVYCSITFEYNGAIADDSIAIEIRELPSDNVKRIAIIYDTPATRTLYKGSVITLTPPIPTIMVFSNETFKYEPASSEEAEEITKNLNYSWSVFDESGENEIESSKDKSLELSDLGEQSESFSARLFSSLDSEDYEIANSSQKYQEYIVNYYVPSGSIKEESQSGYIDIALPQSDEKIIEFTPSANGKYTLKSICSSTNGASLTGSIEIKDANGSQIKATTSTSDNEYITKTTTNLEKDKPYYIHYNNTGTSEVNVKLCIGLGTVINASTPDTTYTGKPYAGINASVSGGSSRTLKYVYSVFDSDANKYVPTTNSNSGANAEGQAPVYPGKYAVDITTDASGNYLSASAHKTFNISALTLSSKNVSVSGSSYVYSGKTIKPTVTVKADNGTVLKDGEDYTVTYPSSSKNVGIYTITITGKGYYTGAPSKTYTVNPKGTSISKLTKGSKAITVKWKKNATQTTGYQIRYSLKSSMASSKTVTVSKSSTISKKISKLKAKKKYYVQIRTYKTVSGKKYYSSWSSKKSVKTK